MVTTIGPKGTKGKSGANPTAGGDGGDASYTLNGTIGLDSTSVILTGGVGGLGGTANTGPGANGGNGGDADATINGNIFKPASKLFDLSVAATGGDGGAGGGGTPQGNGGNGGDGSIVMSGNIVQTSSKLTSITVEADARGGLGGPGGTTGNSGNASANLSGNIIQYSGTPAADAFLVATALGAPGDDPSFDGSSTWGTKIATLSGNVVQGNLNNVTLDADAESSNASASILGNIVQTNVTNTGTVTLEATGQSIDIEKNKVTLGKQALDLTITELGPEYSAKIKGNTFTGSGTNTFVFTDNATPAPSTTPDTIVIDLTAQTFTFDGNSNTLKGFENVTVAGDNDPTIIGDANANILIGGGTDDTIDGGGGNDTIIGSAGNDLLTGGAGNDTIDGGDGLFDTAVYSGNFAQYNVSFVHTGTLAGTVTDTVAGRDGTDTLTNVEYLKFADGLYDTTTGTFTPNNTTLNHAPAGTDKTLTINEDNSYTFATSDFGFTDPNDNPANNLLAVEITTLPVHGTLTDNGVAVTAGSFVSATDIAGGKLVFTPAANANGNGYGNFTFQVQDDGGTAGGGQNTDQSPNNMTINVTSVNDAPAGTNKILTINEDNSYTFAASDFGFTDPNDNPANNFLSVEITTLPANGTLLDNGVAVTAGSFVSAADIAANKLVFTPAANANGNGYGNFTFQVRDDGGTANGGQDTDQSPNNMTINVTSVNDAPAGTDKIITAVENTSYTFATSDFGFTDPNDNPANNFLSVEITTLPAHGTLLDNGVAVTAGSFVSAADIAANKLVFTPAIGATGNGYGNFTFQVRDDGGTANGGQDTDQSPNNMTINVTSTTLNHAPAGTDKTLTINEDNSYTFATSDFGFTDPNDNPANNLQAVEITSLPAHGTLLDNGVAVTAGSFVSAADIAAGKLVFTPAANANGLNYGNFTFQVQDDGGTAGGGQNTDQSPNNMTINVTSVNDAPAGTDKILTINEDNSYTFATSDFGFTDPNDNPANNFLSVEITTLPANGTLLDNGVAVTAGSFVSAADIAANKLVFTPAANANGLNYGNFTFQVQDDGGTANGGQNTDQSPNTMTINVTSVNDAPAGTDKILTINEDNSYTFATSDFGFTDPNDNPANNFLSVEITTLPANGTLLDNGVAVTAGSFVSVADIAANKLVFTPAANANGNGYGNFTFQVRDDGGTANGGQNTDQSPNNMTINVTSVNDAPAGTNKILTINEDNSYTFAASDFGFTDPNDNPANNFLSVEITTLPANGTLLDNGVAVTAGSFVSVADIAANKLVFTPAANANGNGYGNFTFQVQDDGGTANGGQNTDQSPNTMTINVTSVNDAPAGTDKILTINEDNSYTFATSDFGFTDPNDNPANNFLAVEITSLPANGTLLDNGVAVTAGSFVSAADIAANKLVFTPAANANGANYGNFTFQVQDDGGTANGGQNTDQSPNNMTINVTSVNDAPVGTANTIMATENTSYTFSTTDFGFTDPNDNPANNFLSVEITTLPANGTLLDNGVAVTAGSFVSVADIAANKLVYTPAANASGNGYGNFTFQVRDDGGTANGGMDTDPNPKAMTVNVQQALVVNPGDSINAAIAAAHPGDTILIMPGTYTENVVVNKAGITLQGEGPGVVIEGTFTQDNGNFAGPLSTWLQTAPNYNGSSGTGVTVSADNVTLNNITVDNFLTGVAVSGASVSGLTLEGVTTQHSVIGFSKPDDTALNGATIDGSTFQDEYIGTGFFNDSGATGGPGGGQDATNTSITNSTFQNIDTKGVYMETAQGTTTLDGLTMTNVGVYGSVPSFGANGLNGNAIDINLKYHTYTGDLTISNFDLTNTGSSAGQNGAIVVEGRDDPPTYSNAPVADVSGLNVTIENGTIDGTTTGIRAGENKADPSQNDTGPAVTVTNVAITGATVAQIDNHTDSLMTINGTAGDDTYVSALTPGSTGSLTINGLGGNDTLGGGLGDDMLFGGPGNDTLLASGGNDVLNGGAGNDTADFSQSTNGVNVSLLATGFQNLDDFGAVKLVNIENLTGSNYNDVLEGDINNNVLQGGAGNDTLIATPGKDTLDGGAGTDTADFSAFGSGVTVNLNAAGYQTFDGTDQVKLISIENLIGGAGDDTLKGDTNNNVLIGGAGDDILSGGGGTTDIYYGGPGNDTITGTNGSDTDVAYYSGQETSYTITGNLGGVGVIVSGPDGTDTLNRVNRVKFLAPSHVSDLDNNGASDLVYQDSGTGTIVTVNHPGGAMNTLSGSPTSDWRAVGTGQFNPDAAGLTARKAGILLQDTAAGANNGDLEIITGISGTSSTTVPLSGVAAGTFTGFTAITAGDYNGDAASDVLLWNGATQTAEIAFLNVNANEAVGTVDAITTIAGAPTGGNWAPVASGDFDGDGKSDILWQNGVGGAVEITLMNGASITNPLTTPLNTTPGFKAVGTGDFDGDGKSDILFATGGPGSAAEIWTINGDSVTNSFDINAPTAGASGAGTFTLKGAEDINGDGFSDLLWQNAVNGDVVATEMTAGGNVLATVNLGAPASSFHLVASTGGG